MKVMPVADKSHIQATTSNETATRARAVAAFANPGESPAQRQAPQGNEVVQNQSAVSVEELGALRQSTISEDTAQAEPVVESTDEVVAEEPKKTPTNDPLSRQFAILARQEKALRAKQMQQEQSYKAKDAALVAREQALTQSSDRSGYVDLSRLKTSPLEVMAEAGLSYDELTQQLLNQTPRDPRVESQMAKQEAKIAALEARLEAAAKQSNEAQEAQYQTAVETIRADVKAMVANDPNFETIKATNSVKDVVELIQKTWDEDKILLTNEEAAQQVEDHLVEQLTKYSKINKIRARLNANASPSQKAAPAQTPAGQTQTTKQPQPMKTLTNATSSTRPLSAKERAMMAFRGEKF